jgi:hypothetical protein
MVEYIPCYFAPELHCGFLPATRLASRKILIEQNIKKWTGPALYVQYSVVSTMNKKIHEMLIGVKSPGY